MIENNTSGANSTIGSSPMSKESAKLSSVWLWVTSLAFFAGAIGFVPYLIVLAVGIEMDLRMLKKAGFVGTKGWRWIGLVIPIAYVIIRIRKVSQWVPSKKFETDKERWIDFAKRYAAALIWVPILLLTIIGNIFGGCTSTTARLENRIKLQIQERASSPDIKVDNISLIHVDENLYSGIVKLHNDSTGEERIGRINVVYDGKNIAWEIED